MNIEGLRREAALLLCCSRTTPDSHALTCAASLLQEEIVDRYGKLPDAARALLETHRLRLVAERLGVRKIDASADSIVIQFGPNTPVDPARVIGMMQRSKTMRLAGPDRLRIDEKTPHLEARAQRLREVFKVLV